MSWLDRAIVYEIYPQSFSDSDGDGIGDFRGATARLDYLQWLGIDTIWLNPCFESPFVDAGYDVSDYFKVAERYGGNDALIEFMAEARSRGIRVLLDLVVGHTSDQHAMFQAELRSTELDPAEARYIWAVNPPAAVEQVGIPGQTPWVRASGPRGGHYLKNFFEQQPALNFGYARLDAAEPWRQPVSAPGPQANRQLLRDIISFWVERGAAGFRVDMAFSLVKDDPGLVETLALWRELRDWLDEKYPETVLIPEGTEPLTASEPSFHADFFLVIGDEHRSLFANGGAGRLPWDPQAGPCFFDSAAVGSTSVFLEGWERVRSQRPGRTILLATADHDYARLATGRREGRQLHAAMMMVFTWASVPSLYYGDEIGMRFVDGLPDKEGSVCAPGFYNRAGVRTPMQWDSSANAGFSTAAAADLLYLPVDPDPDRPDVAAQLADPGSLLHFTRSLISLRKTTPALNDGADPVVLHSGYPFVFLRGERHLVVINPAGEPRGCDLPELLGEDADWGLMLGEGVEVVGGRVECEAFGHAVLERSS